MISHYCKCGNLRRHNQRNCHQCHADATRKYRRKTPLTKLQRKKMNCRAYAKVYLKRGKLIKQPCESCSDPNTQMHHDDYNKPLNVKWLCRQCHLELHNVARGTSPKP